jgi:O-phospho-L-seryl-tRNASec:L-selenocysteinyl-tRNA synthase
MALPLLLPSATGMALTLVLLAAAGAPAAARAGPAAATAAGGEKQPAAAAESSVQPAAEPAASMQHNQQQQRDSRDPPAEQLPRCVVWSRIDQKTCLKAITAANLVPVVVELLQQGDELVSDVTGMQQAVERVGPANVAAVVTTTSCFAPR